MVHGEDIEPDEEGYVTRWEIVRPQEDQRILEVWELLKAENHNLTQFRPRPTSFPPNVRLQPPSLQNYWIANEFKNAHDAAYAKARGLEFEKMGRLCTPIILDSLLSGEPPPSTLLGDLSREALVTLISDRSMRGSPLRYLARRALGLDEESDGRAKLEERQFERVSLLSELLREEVEQSREEHMAMVASLSEQLGWGSRKKRGEGFSLPDQFGKLKFIFSEGERGGPRWNISIINHTTREEVNQVEFDFTSPPPKRARLRRATLLSTQTTSRDTHGRTGPPGPESGPDPTDRSHPSLRGWDRDQPPAILEEGPQDFREMRVYDCTNRKKLENVQAPSTVQCEEEDLPMDEEDVEFELLQLTTSLVVPARACRVRESKLPYQCGNYDHVTLITSGLTLFRPKKVNTSECEGYHRDQKVKVKINPTASKEETKIFDLKVNNTSQIGYDDLGKVTVGGEIHCEGVKTKIDGTDVYDVVRYNQLDIELTEEKIVETSSFQVVSQEDGTIFPKRCQLSKGSCEMDTETFLWDPPQGMDTCKLFFVRTVQGKLVKVFDSNTNRRKEKHRIVIDDEQMMYFTIGDMVAHCGRRMFATNFKNLYLVPVDKRGFQSFKDRPIDPSMMSELTYTNAKSAWMANFAQREVNEKIRKILEFECERNRLDASNRYNTLVSRQHAREAGTTFELEPGRYATSIAETFYTYECEEMVALAVDDDRCFDSLPIMLSPGDRVKYEERRQAMNQALIEAGMNEATDFIPVEELELFMTPLTHVITSEATELSCSLQMAPTYKNALDGWIVAAPSVIPTTTPRTLTFRNDRPGFLDDYSDAGLDWDDAGIYSFLSIQLMEETSRLPYLRQAGTATFAKASGSAGYFTRSAKADYVHKGLHIPPTSILDAIARVITVVSRIGLIFALFTGAAAVVSLVNYLMEICTAMMFPDGPRSKAMAAAICPPIYRLIRAASHWYYDVIPRDRRQKTEERPSSGAPSEDDSSSSSSSPSSSADSDSPSQHSADPALEQTATKRVHWGPNTSKVRSSKKEAKAHQALQTTLRKRKRVIIPERAIRSLSDQSTDTRLPPSERSCCDHPRSLQQSLLFEGGPRLILVITSSLPSPSGRPSSPCRLSVQTTLFLIRCGSLRQSPW